MKNKKVLIITLISLGIFIILSLIIGYYFFIKFNNKKPLSEEEFKNIMETLSYKVENTKENYSEYEEIKNVLKVSEENKYEITFIIFEEDEYALRYYRNAKSYFNARKDNYSTNSYVNFKNYSKYTFTQNDNYVSITRIKNTILNIISKSENKKEIKNIIKKLNY